MSSLFCVERPVGFAEEDVYVIQSRYNEAEKEIKRLKGLKVSEPANQHAATNYLSGCIYICILGAAVSPVLFFCYT